MAARVAEFVVGLALAWVTLRDVFYTVVVPGGPRGLLKVSRRLVRAALPLWKRTRGRVSVNFAPLALVGSFAVWMGLLVLGFGLMVHAVESQFEPPLDGFGHALYVAGAAMGTIGFGSTEPHGFARVVAVLAGFCGLGVMTPAVTYLLEVQSNIAQRDTGVLKLTTTAGQPPCALTIFERYAALHCRGQLAVLLGQGRDWCATMLQSHASHPSLIYFRSAGTGSGWPAALGTMVDVALIAELLVAEPDLRAFAVLAREEADRLAQDLAGLLDLAPARVATRPDEADRLVARLTAAGYRMREDRDCAAFVAARDRHLACVQALSHHLGTPDAPLVPGG